MDGRPSSAAALERLPDEVCTDSCLNSPSIHLELKGSSAPTPLPIGVFYSYSSPLQAEMLYIKIMLLTKVVIRVISHMSYVPIPNVKGVVC